MEVFIDRWSDHMGVLCGWAHRGRESPVRECGRVEGKRDGDHGDLKVMVRNYCNALSVGKGLTGV